MQVCMHTHTHTHTDKKIHRQTIKTKVHLYAGYITLTIKMQKIKKLHKNINAEDHTSTEIYSSLSFLAFPLHTSKPLYPLNGHFIIQTQGTPLSMWFPYT